MKQKTKKSLSCFTAFLIGAALAPATGLMTSAVVHAADQQQTGNKDGYDFELWNQNGQGSVNMDVGSNGAFSCSWSNIENCLFRTGKKLGSTQNWQSYGGISIDYDVDYKPEGNSYMCVYGWTEDPTVEYYIVEAWGDWRPPGQTGGKGTVSADGKTYDIYTSTRVNQPSIHGTETFEQYWSVNQTNPAQVYQMKNLKGTISVSTHFEQWERAGMKMGKMYEVALNIEGYRSNGSANVKMNNLTIGGGGGGGQQQSWDQPQQNNDWNNQNNNWDQNQNQDWNNQNNNWDQNWNQDWNNQNNNWDQNWNQDWNNQNNNWDQNQWNQNQDWNNQNNWDQNWNQDWNNQNNNWDQNQWNQNQDWNNQNYDWNNQNWNQDWNNQNNNWDQNQWNQNQDWNNQNNNWDQNQWNQNQDWNNQNNNWDQNQWNQNQDWNNQNQWSQDWNNQNNNWDQNWNQNNDWNNQNNNQNFQPAATGTNEPAANAKMTADFRKGASPEFFASDGWTNGDPFNCGWYASNTSLDGGKLTLKIDKDYTGKYEYAGAEYRSQNFYGFGYYETSMKAIKNDGVVSSFFTYTGESDNNPWDEIDIEILGKDTTKVQFNYYTNGKADHEYMYDLGFDASQGFHKFGFDWQRDHITWYVDGKAVYTAYDNIPQTPGKIMVNAWNGKGVDDWLNAFNGRTPLTAEYEYITFSDSAPASNGGQNWNNQAWQLSTFDAANASGYVTTYVTSNGTVTE